MKTLYVLLVMAASCVFAQQAAKDIYQDKCAGCHGADGAAATARGKKLKIKSTKELTAKVSEEQMIKSVTDGKGADMPAYSKELNAAQIKDVTGYFRSLGK